MKKILSICQKTILEYLREPVLLVMLFAFPVLLLSIYYVGFGQKDQGLSQYLSVAVLNRDEGGQRADGLWWGGEALAESLRSARYDGAPVFKVFTVTDETSARIALRERKISLMVIIPPEFSQSLLDISAGKSTPPAAVTLLGDPHSTTFVFAQGFINGLVYDFARQTLGWQMEVDIPYEFVTGTGTMSDFDFGVPGMIIFGLSLLVVTTAQTLVREKENGTLRRLRLTAAGAIHLLPGIALAQMALALALTPFIFGVAVLMGFQNHGSFLIAMGVCILFSLPMVGVGLITASITRTDGEAANLGATLGVLMALLSGAMYPMPNAPLFTLGRRTIQIYDLLPPTHAAAAMRRVLVLGDGLESIGFELAALAGLSILFLATGIVLYGQLRMKNEA